MTKLISSFKDITDIELMMIEGGDIYDQQKADTAAENRARADREALYRRANEIINGGLWGTSGS